MGSTTRFAKGVGMALKWHTRRSTKSHIAEIAGLRIMKRQFLVAISLLLASGAVFAASQGTPGTSSNGSVNLSLTMQRQVVVAGLDDITINAAGWDGSSDIVSAAEDFCIGQNMGFGFSLTFTSGNGGAGSFTAEDGSNNPVDYNVYFANGTGATIGDTPATSGSALTTTTDGVSPTPQQNLSCGSNNASMIVEFPGTNLQAASNDGTAYTDTITVQVAPE
jgi:hypothetical protein